MSKGIAIETILYLLVGIIVVGIVIYLVYTYAIGAPIGEQECRGMAISWCTSCKNVAWTGGVNAPDTLQKCVSDYFSPPSGAGWQSTSPYCDDCDCDKSGNEDTFCSTFIPA